MPTILVRSRSHTWTQRRIALNGSVLRVLIVDDNQNAAQALAAYFAGEEIGVSGGIRRGRGNRRRERLESARDRHGHLDAGLQRL